MGAKPEGREEKSIHPRQNPHALLSRQLGISKHTSRSAKAQISLTLCLTPITPSALRKLRVSNLEEIGPRHGVVDDCRQARCLSNPIGVSHHHIVIRTKQIVHRDHLQRRHTETRHPSPSFDRCLCAVTNDSSDDRTLSLHFFRGGRCDSQGSVCGQPAAFPSATAHRGAVRQMGDP